MKHNYSITCENIIISPMNEMESELYRRLRNRDDNRKEFFDQNIIEKEQQKKWFDKYLKRSDQIMFSVYLKDSKEFIGGLGVYDINMDKKIAEVGRIIIDKERCKGKGYGAEALKGTSQMARNVGLKHLYAYIYSGNQASIKTFQKAGYCISKKDSSEEVVKVLYELK